MKTIKSVPRGYCHGVVSALNIVSETIKNNNTNKPIYILGEIVHNKYIKNAFLEAGAITLENNTRSEMIDSITDGIVIITAHGIDANLIEKAKTKGLTVIDATCTDVKKTQTLIKNKLSENYDVIFLGKKNHPETEGIIAIDSNIHLITTKEEINSLTITNSKIIITNQTTMSKYDTKNIFDYAKLKFPTLEIINEICEATSLRQESALQDSKKANLTLVVGDINSNNTNKLAEISKNASNKAYRINSVEDIDINWLLDKKVDCVHITSGASTPTQITKEVIDFVENFKKDDKSTWDTTSKINISRLIPRT